MDFRFELVYLCIEIYFKHQPPPPSEPNGQHIMKTKITFNSKFNPDGTPLPEGTVRVLELSVSGRLDAGEVGGYWSAPCTGGWKNLRWEAVNFDSSELARVETEMVATYKRDVEDIFTDALEEACDNDCP